MRTLTAVCCGLLLSIAACVARAQEVTPKARMDLAVPRLPALGDLRGKTCDEARDELRKLHVVLETCPVGRATGAYPAGTINAQSLATGTPASRLEGLRVTLEPRPAPAPAAVLPDLRGKTCDQAQAELRRLRLALTVCQPGAAGLRYPAGTINAQSVAPGTPVSRVDGLRVTYEPAAQAAPRTADAISDTGRGRDAAAAALAAAVAAAIADAAAPKLPDLRGMSCEQAQAALRTHGLALVECLPGKAGSRYPAGTISAQSQPPGTPLARVDRLRARFEPWSAPSEPPRLPDLRGMTCDEAAEALAARRLRYTSCAPGAGVQGVSPGRINGQSPDAGSALPLAAPIVLRVQPAPQVIVPALVGLGEAQAASALAGRRLQARPSGPAAAQGRRVLSQSPVAGTAVSPGSTVEITLGLSVPRLLDLDCASARARASAFGHREFSCLSRAAPAADARIGRVFEQAPPEAGPALAAPAEIRVVVWAAQAVTVPDVVGQALDAAQQRLRQARLRDGPDAQDHAADRVVQAQAPAAHARVAADSLVQLSTKRFVTVPDLGGRTCAEARAAVAPDTLALSCDDESSWRVTVFGTPRVVAQQPDAHTRAEVGTPLVAQARAPLPASLPWLASVPLVAVAGVALAPLLGLALWIVRLAPRPPPAVLPIVPPPRAPAVDWRLDADAAPSLSLRWRAAGAQAAGRGPRRDASGMAWRVVPDAGHVLLRESEVSSGDKHAER